jgi:hypothetical protein
MLYILIINIIKKITIMDLENQNLLEIQNYTSNIEIQTNSLDIGTLVKVAGGTKLA